MLSRDKQNGKKNFVSLKLKKACISGMFADDYNIINIIPYHSAPSLVLIEYIDLSFLLFIAANKYLKKLFDCTFVITPKCILWFVVI